MLDYGCGKGDLLSFLQARGIAVDYTGTDINPALIAFAEGKHPEANFRVFDIEDAPLEKDFDYIFACGIFNNRIEDIERTMRNILTKLFAHTRIALAFDALSINAATKVTELHYHDPASTLRFCADELSPHVAIDESIPDNFTIFVRREAKRHG